MLLIIFLANSAICGGRFSQPITSSTLNILSVMDSDMAVVVISRLVVINSKFITTPVVMITGKKYSTRKNSRPRNL